MAQQTLMDIARGLSKITGLEEAEAQKEILFESQIDFKAEDAGLFKLLTERINNKVNNFKDATGKLEGHKLAFADYIAEQEKFLITDLEAGLLERKIVKARALKMYHHCNKKGGFFSLLPDGANKESNAMLTKYHKICDELEAQAKADKFEAMKNNSQEDAM